LDSTVAKASAYLLPPDSDLVSSREVGRGAMDVKVHPMEPEGGPPLPPLRAMGSGGEAVGTVAKPQATGGSTAFSRFLRTCDDKRCEAGIMCLTSAWDEGRVRLAYCNRAGGVFLSMLDNPAGTFVEGVELAGNLDTHDKVTARQLVFHPKSPDVLVAARSNGKLLAFTLREGEWRKQEVYVGGSVAHHGMLARKNTMQKQAARISLSFSPDGEQLAVGWEGKVHLVGTSNIMGLEILGEDGKKEKALDPGWEIDKWDWKSGGCLQSDDRSLDSVVFAHCPGAPGRGSEQLVACCAANDGLLWRVGGASAGEEGGDVPPPTRLRGHTRGVLSIRFSPQADVIATSSEDMTIRIWEVASGSCMDVLKGHQGRVTSIAFQSDEVLASVSVDHSARLWDVKLGACVAHFKLEDQVSRVACVDLPRKADNAVWGAFVATGSTNGNISLLETSSGTNETVLPQAQGTKMVQCLAVRGSHVAASFANGKVFVWGLGRGHAHPTDLSELADKIGHPIGEKPEYAVAFSPAGDVIASGGTNRDVHLWKQDGGGEWQALAVLKHRINDKSVMEDIYGISFSPDGRYLATSGEDRSVRVWDVQGLTPADTITPVLQPRICFAAGPAEYKRIHTVAFHPVVEGGSTWRLVIGTGNGTVQSYKFDESTPEGGCECSWSQKNAHSKLVHYLAYNRAAGGSDPASKMLLASASFDNTLKLWDDDGALLATLGDHSTGVKSVTWSPDGRYIASCAFSGLIYFWGPVDPEDIVKTAVLKHGMNGGGQAGLPVTCVAWEAGGPGTGGDVFVYGKQAGDVVWADTSFMDQAALPFSHAHKFLESNNDEIIGAFEKLAKLQPWTLSSFGHLKGQGSLLHATISLDYPVTMEKLLQLPLAPSQTFVTTRTADFKASDGGSDGSWKTSFSGSRIPKKANSVKMSATDKKTEFFMADPLAASYTSKPCAEKLADALIDSGGAKALASDKGSDAIIILASECPDLATKLLNRVHF